MDYNIACNLFVIGKEIMMEKKDVVRSLEYPSDLNVQCKWMRTLVKASHLMQVRTLLSLDKIDTYVYKQLKKM